MLKKMLKNERGLTLIELLAVVVILGIIAAIAVPAIGGIINKSKEDAAVAEASQIIDATKLYITNEDPAFNAQGTLTITQATDDLDKYLDKTSDFSMSVAKSNDSFTYTITGHKVNEITEFKSGATEANIKNRLDN